jgi:hypothetical protein
MNNFETLEKYAIGHIYVNTYNVERKYKIDCSVYTYEAQKNVLNTYECSSIVSFSKRHYFNIFLKLKVCNIVLAYI